MHRSLGSTRHIVMVTTPSFASLALLLPALLTGCWLDTSTTRHDGTITTSTTLETVAPAVGQGIVRLLNEPDTDIAFLHGQVGLEGLIASSLIAERNGEDGLSDTDDDLPFDSLSDVYAIPEVDDLSIRLLGHAAQDADLVPVRAIEGVLFSARELRDTLALANDADEDELLDLGLDRRALGSILWARPFETLTDAADEPHIGPSALRDLRSGTTRSVREESA
jgi:hypothetical protein